MSDISNYPRNGDPMPFRGQFFHLRDAAGVMVSPEPLHCKLRETRAGTRDTDGREATAQAPLPERSPVSRALQPSQSPFSSIPVLPSVDFQEEITP